LYSDPSFVSGNFKPEVDTFVFGFFIFGEIDLGLVDFGGLTAYLL